MYIKTYSYRYAEEILQHERHKETFEELLDICKKCPFLCMRGSQKIKKIGCCSTNYEYILLGSIYDARMEGELSNIIEPDL